MASKSEAPSTGAIAAKLGTQPATVRARPAAAAAAFTGFSVRVPTLTATCGQRGSLSAEAEGPDGDRETIYVEQPRERVAATTLADLPASCRLSFAIEGRLSRIRCAIQHGPSQEAVAEALLKDLESRYGAPRSDLEGDFEFWWRGKGERWTWWDEEASLILAATSSRIRRCQRGGRSSVSFCAAGESDGDSGETAGATTRSAYGARCSLPVGRPPDERRVY